MRRSLAMGPLLLVAILLPACGNIQVIKSFSTPYQEPASGPRARIRVVSDGMVRAVPNSACIDWRLEGAGVMVVPSSGFANMNGRTLGMPTSPAQELTAGTTRFAVSELYVPAGKPLALAYIGIAKGNCFVEASFVPDEGMDYEASAFLGGKTCGELSVKRIDGSTPPIPVPLMRAKLCRASDAF